MICECGCGLPAAISTRSNKRLGIQKGQPRRFHYGHKAASVTAKAYRTVTVGPRRCVLAHIVIAETALGRKLPKGAEVHHVDENKRNNTLANLVICENHAYHLLLHVRARIVRAGGNPNTDKVCGICQKPLPLASFQTQTSGTLGLGSRCNECARAYQRTLYFSKRASSVPPRVYNTRMRP